MPTTSAEFFNEAAPRVIFEDDCLLIVCKPPRWHSVALKVTQAENTQVTQCENTQVAQSVDAQITQTENTKVTQCENTQVAQSVDAQITQTENTQVTQCENTQVIQSAAAPVLTDWLFREYPQYYFESAHSRAGEGGLLMRLDYETSGLMLVAKNEATLLALQELQNKNGITKDYRFVSAVAASAEQALPRPPLAIASHFRRYGPGGARVRCVGADELKNKPQHRAVTATLYQTELLELGPCSGLVAPAGYRLLKGSARITKGFMHQIRAQLAWIGLPLFGDPLYHPLANSQVAKENSPPPPAPRLFLQAQRLSFQLPELQKNIDVSLS